MISAHLLPPLLDKWCSDVVAKQTRLTDKALVMCQRNKDTSCLAYLIIVTDAADAVSVNFFGRCKFLQI